VTQARSQALGNNVQKQKQKTKRTMNVEYDEFGREVRMRSTASNVAGSMQNRRERSPTGRRRDRSRSPASKYGNNNNNNGGGGNRERRRSRTPPEMRRRRDDDDDDDADDKDGKREEGAFADELSRYRATHHPDQHFDLSQHERKQGPQHAQQQKKSSSTAMEMVQLPSGLDEDEMMKMLGLPSQFDTTHEKHVEGADASGARVIKKRKARQYMNVVRRGADGQPQAGPTRRR
jgi:U4/U6.U5 tri-snRNP-associated protein 3